MYIFRPHRGGLAEAMAEARIFKTADEMFDHIISINTFCGMQMLNRDDLSIDTEKTSDPRIGWEDCSYVLTKRYHEKVYDTPICVGYCATIFPPYKAKK